MILREKLLAIKHKEKLTASELADKLGVNTSTLNNWLYKDQDPTSFQIKLMVWSTGISADYWLDLTDEIRYIDDNRHKFTKFR